MTLTRILPGIFAVLTLTHAAHADMDCAAWNTSAFFEAATVSHIERCLDAGADVNARNEDGLTPLHWAAQNNDDPAIITSLISAGADVDARDENGVTPLHSAVTYNDNPVIIAALINAGGCQRPQRTWHDTPAPGGGGQ